MKQYDIIYNRMYEGLTAYDIKHIKEIRNYTNKLLSYINDLILLQQNLDYDKGYDTGYDKGFDEGYDRGLGQGYKVGSYMNDR